jgi:NAD(P)-dependent dehydrogenase (short-subunit alcohol dehydrogenase family)
MRDEARLDGKVAVVTGGGRGIGRAAAILLARAGADVVVTARTEEEIDATAKAIREEGGHARAFPTDVADWENVRRLAEETEQQLGPADIVVANAGVIFPVGNTWQVGAERWAYNVGVNLTGAFYAARAFLPAMVDRGSGVLIFVSSGAATHPVAGWSAYCAAKAGVDHFVRTLASEIDQEGLELRAHALYPGIVSTAMQEKIRSVTHEEFAQVDRFRSYHEQGQLRDPEEPGTLIWWLATPMAAEFHGQAVSIDDPAIRRRMANDLGVERFADRGG